MSSLFLLVFSVAFLPAIAADNKSVIGISVKGSLCDYKERCVCHRNHTIQCNFADTQDIVLNGESFPKNTTREVALIGARAITFKKDTLSFLHLIDLLHVENVQYVTFEQNTFRKTKTNSFIMSLKNCGNVTFNRESFSVNGSITANISHCKRVHLQSKTFPKIILIDIHDVKQLILDKEAFFLSGIQPTNNKLKGKQRIYIYDTHIPRLPCDTFVSYILDLKIQNCTIEVIESGAFSSVSLHSIRFIGLRIDEIKKGAFNDGLAVNNFTIDDCTVGLVHSDSIQLSPENMYLINSRMKMQDRAIDVVSINVTIVGNIFKETGLVVKDWNNIVIKENTFEYLSADSVKLVSSQNRTLVFRDNDLKDMEKRSLGFLSSVPLNSLRYENNMLGEICECSKDVWKDFTLRNDSSFLSRFIDNTHCTVADSLMKNCRNLSSSMPIVEYIFLCENKTLYCESSKTSITDYINNQQEADRELFRLLLIIALSVVTCGIVIISIFVLCKRARRKGYCSNVKNAVTSSNSSCFTFFDRLLGINYGLDTARSISRVSINDYTMNHMRTQNDDNRVLMIDDLSLEDLIESCDKATQTLPEELTKELLESLREKLDDPDNYNEAREMIEHLYDLIKVDELCNNNNNPSTSRTDNLSNVENLYDVIQTPCKTFVGKNKKNMVSVGTRVPSFDKLAPLSPYNRQTALCHDYFEPQDHLYSELPDNKYSDIMSQYNLVEDVLRATTPHNYLRAIEKNLATKPLLNPVAGPSGINTSRSIRSNHSNNSEGSSKMANRPLPEKPRDPP